MQLLAEAQMLHVFKVGRQCWQQVDENDSSSAEFFAFAFTAKVKEDLAHQSEENAS